MAQTPLGGVGWSDEGRGYSLDESPLVPLGPAHVSQPGQGEDGVAGRLFERGDEEGGQGADDFVFGGLAALGVVDLGVEQRPARGDDALVAFGHALETLEGVEGEALEHQRRAEAGRHVARELDNARSSGCGRVVVVVHVSKEAVRQGREGIAAVPSPPLDLEPPLLPPLQLEQVLGEHHRVPPLEPRQLLLEVLARPGPVGGRDGVEPLELPEVEGELARGRRALVAGGGAVGAERVERLARPVAVEVVLVRLLVAEAEVEPVLVPRGRVLLHLLAVAVAVAGVAVAAVANAQVLQLRRLVLRQPRLAHEPLERRRLLRPGPHRHQRQRRPPRKAQVAPQRRRGGHGAPLPPPPLQQRLHRVVPRLARRAQVQLRPSPHVHRVLDAQQRQFGRVRRLGRHRRLQGDVLRVVRRVQGGRGGVRGDGRRLLPVAVAVGRLEARYRALGPGASSGWRVLRHGVPSTVVGARV